MSFEFTIRGHSADPHNAVVKSAFDSTILALRATFGTTGTVNGEGYSTDPAGTQEFDSTQTVDLSAAAQTKEAKLAAAQYAATQAESELATATAKKKAADEELAALQGAPAEETPAEEGTETPAEEGTEETPAKPVPPAVP